MNFNIDYVEGKYICGRCGRKFEVSYYRKREYGRIMTNRLPHSAKANFIRHLKACYKKEKVSKE